MSDVTKMNKMMGGGWEEARGTSQRSLSKDLDEEEEAYRKSRPLAKQEKWDPQIEMSLVRLGQGRPPSMEHRRGGVGGTE